MEVDELIEQEATTTINFKPSFVLIAIDTHASMFEIRTDDEIEETHSFKDALSACYEIADSLILSTSRSNYNQFGIVLADEDQNASLIEVENNLLDTVKLLKEKHLESNEDLKTQYERKGELDLGAFFLLCKKKFKSINSAYYKRTIIFITNDDDPVGGDVKKRFTALNEAKTFEAGDIHFELITMKADFEYSKFYNELFHLFTKPPTSDVLCNDKDGLVEQLQSSIIFRYTKLRYNFYPFKDDYSRYLKVMKVSFIRKPRLYNTEKASYDGKLLKRVRPELGIDNPNIGCEFQLQIENEEVLTLDLKDKYDIYGNDLPLGLHLQYVSKRQSSPGVVLNNTTILILDPKEDLPYFEQFWQYCVDNDKVMICIKKYLHPVEIRFVELVPKYANNEKMFLIIDLPFTNELVIPMDIQVESDQYEKNEEKNEVVRKLVDQLSFDYDPKIFINPSYGKKKAYVKAKLLDLPQEEVDDPTEDTEGIDEQIRDIVKEIKQVFNFSNPQGTKRKTTTTTSRGRGKKAAK